MSGDDRDADWQWRQIDSTPRGISFLAWCGANDEHESERWAVCYISIDGALCYDTGGFCADDSDNDFRPTHWMALPEPPLEGEGR